LDSAGKLSVDFGALGIRFSLLPSLDFVVESIEQFFGVTNFPMNANQIERYYPPSYRQTHIIPPYDNDQHSPLPYLWGALCDLLGDK
jgi:hypothetical protein